MTVYYEVYKGILLEIFYEENGLCYAACDNPFGGFIESKRFQTPREAFENIKTILDVSWFED